MLNLQSEILQRYIFQKQIITKGKCETIMSCFGQVHQIFLFVHIKANATAVVLPLAQLSEKISKPSLFCTNTFLHNEGVNIFKSNDSLLYTISLQNDWYCCMFLFYSAKKSHRYWSIFIIEVYKSTFQAASSGTRSILRGLGLECDYSVLIYWNSGDIAFRLQNGSRFTGQFIKLLMLMAVFHVCQIELKEWGSCFFCAKFKYHVRSSPSSIFS